MTRFATTLVLGSLVLAGAAHAQLPTFAPVSTYSAGPASNPTGLAVADVNGDQKPDVLTANGTTGANGVLLGTGTGAFPTCASYQTGPGPAGVVAADLNSDGYPDLISATGSPLVAGGPTVSIVLGNGNGTFRPAYFWTAGSIGLGYVVAGVAVADINRDGKADLLTANGTAFSISVMRGNGNGTFQAGLSYGVGGIQPYALAVADLNADGNADILAAGLNTTAVAVLLGSGNGTFGSIGTFQSGLSSRIYSVAAADVNGDGRPDLLTANYNTSLVGVSLGNGNGTFQPAAMYSPGLNSYPRSLVVADINRDGRPDVLTANYNSSTVGVLLGNGNGTFQAARTYSSGPGSTPCGIAVADVNRDGRPDLLTANIGSNTVGVLLNTTPLPTRAALPGTTTSLSPNPAGAATVLRVAGLPASVAEVQATVLDATGREVARLRLIARQDAAQAELPTAGLAPGLYVVQLLGHDGQGAPVGELPTQRLSVQSIPAKMTSSCH